MKLLAPEPDPLAEGLQDQHIEFHEGLQDQHIEDHEDQQKKTHQTNRVPVRLVVCVDGTWGEPDGIHQAFEGNISNIYRIHCSVKEGEVRDSTGTRWKQQTKYFKGLNNPNNWGGKLMSGAFGTGIHEQIKDVYRYCCEHASFPEDEIFFFGFSRGGFVVRAVANMLCHMRVPNLTRESSTTFDEMYKEALALYQDVRRGAAFKAGSIHAYLDKCQPPPAIRFIGVLDTVKAVDDKGFYDVSLMDSLHHCRQALALNETKTAFAPEIWAVAQDSPEFELRATSNDHSLLQAWFLGVHGDLGGSNAQDGCALYPLQWLLSEARDVGLALGFRPTTRTTTILRQEVDLDDPLALVFPKLTGSSQNEPSSPNTLTSENGIQVKMWDIGSVHKMQRYRIRLNRSRTNKFIFSTAPREVFDQDRLMGYHDKGPVGVFIHPSAYLIYDREFLISANSRDWCFQEEFCNFRRKVVSREDEKVWEQSSEVIDENIKKVRILVCGPAGVGKSSLLNKVLGVPDLSPESGSDHGVHDINKGFSPEVGQYVIHDSCGFTIGGPSELDSVKNFLRERSTCGELSERLHAIWYCVSTTRLRTTEPADKVFFETLADCDSNVPVVIIFTRKDELEDQCRSQAEKQYMSEHRIRSRRGLSHEAFDIIDSDCERRIDARKQELMNGFAGQNYHASVYVAKDDEDSISALVDETTGCLTSHKVRKLFISAQICSVQPKIDMAITNSLRLYAHAVRTTAIPIAFSGFAATTTVTAIICTDVLKIFQYPTFNVDIALRTISNALLRNWEANAIQMAGQVLGSAGAIVTGTGVGWLPGVALLAGAAVANTVAVPQYGRLLLMCTVDVVLIMERVYWKTLMSNGQATAQDVEEACDWYSRNRVKAVHEDIKALLPVWNIWGAFQYDRLNVGLAKILEDHRFQKEADTHCDDE